MKELDFDELDRAVNSLMSDVPRSPVPKTDDIKTITLTPASPLPPSPATDAVPATVTPSQPIVDSVVPPAVPVTPVTPPTPVSSSPLVPTRATLSVTPPAARRGGRFMDVVHPSSDMTQASSVPTVAPRASGGLVLAPLSSPEELAAQTVPLPVYERKAAPAPPAPEPTSPSTTPAQTNDWPDPLDLANFGDTLKTEPELPVSIADEEPATTPLPTPIDAPAVTPAPIVTTPTPEPEPLSSPFLPDAKVEKRPLGGTPDTEPAPEPDHTPVIGDGSDVSTTAGSEQLIPSPVQEPIALPAELSSDIVAIESNQATETAPLDDEPRQPVTAASIQPNHFPDHSQPVGSTSIAQQYDEQPSTGEKSHGAIYDTPNFHQPLAHPAKKRSGWLVPLLILIIILVGIGVGAAIYFFYPSLLTKL